MHSSVSEKLSQDFSVLPPHAPTPPLPDRREQEDTVSTKAFAGHSAEQVQALLEDHVRIYLASQPPPGTNRPTDCGHFTRLGKGTYGEVLKIKKQLPGATDNLAMKVNMEDINENDAYEEAQILKRFDHPNIVTSPGLYHQPATQKVFFLMPVLQEDLNQRIADIKVRPLSLADRLNISCQAAKALAYVHSKELVHRDVTTRNFMFSPNNHVVLIDFGRAERIGGINPDFKKIPKEIDEKNIVPIFNKFFSCTYLQLAPEELYDMQVAETNDIYGWGTILLSLLKGKNHWMFWTCHPTCRFMTRCHRICNHEWLNYKPKSCLRSCTSQEDIMKLDPMLKWSRTQHRDNFTAFITKCLKLEPDERPQSMDNVIAELAKLSSESLPSQTAAPVSSPSFKTSSYDVDFPHGCKGHH